MKALCSGESGPGLASRLGLVALIVAAFCGRAMFVALPVNSDTAMFVYAGKLVAEGGRPGVDLLDNKLPSVGLLMSAPFRWFGAHWSAYALSGLLLSIVATWFLWRASRDLWGHTPAMAVLVAAAVWLNFPPAVYGQLQLETIQIALASIAGACVLRTLRTNDWRDALTAGLCGGLAMWAKPTGGAVLAAAGATYVLRTTVCISYRGYPARGFSQVGRVAGRMPAIQNTGQASVASLFWLSLGTAVPIVLCVWTIVVTGMADALPETLRQLRSYASESTLNAMDLAKPAMVLGLLSFPVLVLGWIFRRNNRESNAVSADAIFVGFWLLTELAGVISQRRMYAYHFLVLGPPAAMATGLLAKRVDFKALAMAFGPVVMATLLLSITALIDQPAETRDDRVIAYVAGHAGPADKVWADDYPRLLVETNRQPGSAVPLIFLMANGDHAPDQFGQRLLADWAERRPAYIAFAADPAKVADLYKNHMADVAASPARADAIARQLGSLQQYLEANYHSETDIDNVRIWRRGPANASVVATTNGISGCR